jgi:hypothetical protein
MKIKHEGRTYRRFRSPTGSCENCAFFEAEDCPEDARCVERGRRIFEHFIWRETFLSRFLRNYRAAMADLDGAPTDGDEAAR